MDPKIHVAFLDGYNPHAALGELTWGEIVDMLSTTAEPACAPKGVASSLPECAGRTCKAKIIGGWSPVDLSAPHRANENVRGVTAVVLDLDHVDDATLERVRASVADFRHVIHSTHNHTPPDDGCYRLVMPLSRPALPSEWPALWRSIVEVFELPADPVAKDISRFYFLPTVREGAPFHFESRVGAEINVDGALETCPAADSLTANDSPPATMPAPVASDAPINLGTLRKMISDVRISKSHGDERAKRQAELLRRVLDGEPLGDVGDRHAPRRDVTGILAHWLPASTPWESVLEIMRPCLVATPLADGETLDAAIEKTRRLYEGSMKRRLNQDAKRAQENALLKELVDKVRGSASPTYEEIVDGEDDPNAWQKLLILTNSGVRGNEYNAKMILTCAPEVRSTLRWNERTKQIEVGGGALAGVAPSVLPTAAAEFAQRNYGFLGGEKLMAKALLRVARANSYDPVAEMLGELAWDDVPRIDTFLENYFGVGVSDDDGNVDERLLKYVRAVSRRWLISLVARGLKPGEKVDTVLVLEGAQGIGKSTALETLVGSAYFLDTPLVIGDKDSYLAIAGAWLVELGELVSLRRAETDKAKQFFTSKVDKFRVPYAAAIEDSPRGCVFAGSCNPEEGVGYLKDTTGNRRYWPVRVVREIDTGALARDRELILAEAVVAYRNGERHWLEDDEIDLAAAETEKREEESLELELIDRWWYGLKPSRRRRVTLLEVAQEALSISDVEKINQGLRTKIGAALTSLGFIRRQDRKSRFYEATGELVNAPQRTQLMRMAGVTLLTGLRTPPPANT